MENNTQLTIADLESVKNIIEATTSRGAFKADELLAVGTTYNKICLFLKAVQEQTLHEPQQPAPPQEPVPPAEVTPPLQGEENA